MYRNAIVSFLMLIPFLLSGGLTGNARVLLCMERGGGVAFETPAGRCCADEHPANGVPNVQPVAGASADCLTCSDFPMGDGQSKVTRISDLKPTADVSPFEPVLVAAILLPPPPDASLLTAAAPPDLVPAAPHVSIAVTVLRC
jgi:hypothetical protein